MLEAVDLDWKIEPHYVEFEEPAQQDDGPMWHESTYYRYSLAKDEETPLAICLAALKARGVTLT